MAKKDIRNLVFEGGGIKGLAYVGAVEVLEYNGILENVKRVAGSSIGAIIAGLIAVGFKSKDLRELIDIDFKDFKDDSSFPTSNISRLFKRYGWYKGDKIQEWFEKVISDKSWKKGLSFRDLHDMKDKGTKDLYIIGSDVSRESAVIFSYEKTPDMKISEAVRISIGIPFFYEAVNLSGSLFVDGGVYYNYPIDLFDNLDYVDNKKNFSKECNLETLGFRVDNPKKFNIGEFNEGPLENNIDSLKNYIDTLLGTLLDFASKVHLSEKNWKRTIYIDSMGVTASDFNLSDSQKAKLIESGIEATKNWLKK